MPLPVILAVAFGASLLAAIPMFLMMRRSQNRAKQRLIALANGRAPRRQAGARSFGVQSRGKSQVRGTGGLVLFDDELVFVQLMGGEDVRIPRADIVGVESATGFLGKRTARQLLQVSWRTGASTDAAAWEVRELDTWINELGGVRGEVN